MGGLVGDVPPAKNLLKYIRKICTKYNVHLILDEVWCGTGTSGKIYCIDWDGVNPDLVFMGKTLSAGYAPISAVAATKKFENLLIKKNQNRILKYTSRTFVRCSSSTRGSKNNSRKVILKK